jgi:hypothetical protein
MRDLSHYPIGLVPSHVWRRPAPAASKPAPQRAPQGVPETAPQPGSQSTDLPLQGGGRPPELSASEAEAGGWGSRSEANNPRPASLRSATLPLSGEGKNHNANRRTTGTPPPQPSAIRPEAAELYARLFKLVREVRDCWRDCPSGECRRHRRCVSEKYECRDLHRVPRTPEEEAAILADFHRALQRRRAELRAEERGEEG